MLHDNRIQRANRNLANDIHRRRFRSTIFFREFQRKCLNLIATRYTLFSKGWSRFRSEICPESRRLEAWERDESRKRGDTSFERQIGGIPWGVDGISYPRVSACSCARADIISYLAGHFGQWGRPARYAAGIHNEVLSVLVRLPLFFSHFASGSFLPSCASLPWRTL